MKKTNLKGLTLAELKEFVQSLGEPPYRAKQLFSWIYEKKAASFEEMSDISLEFQDTLNKAATLDGLTVADRQTSPADGTLKFLFELHDGRKIESVLIPADPRAAEVDRRLTLCVSTQVGCPLDCAFCATGAMGFSRNLTPGEIVDQVLQAQKLSPRRITNLVFMGMGEPMLNYDNVMTAVILLNDDRSLNIGAKHITISTAGYPEKIRQLADEQRNVKLALSLHSLDNEKRSALMPINKKYPVTILVDAMEYYWRTTRSRPTFEYILFDGFNDTAEDIKKLVALSRRLPSKINIIPFHSIASVHPTGFAAALRPSSAEKIQEFAQKLRNSDLTVMVRRSAGQDIDAACGQLAVKDRLSHGKRTAGRKESIQSRHNSEHVSQT
ncbi:MAG: 23S rRNA (adenine(2503)-C(2))-methyltransferase RlmN [Bacteroidetes bacterium]|nr:23S rRNA (adenine(2503)-C(2))-methyltransferase RlmN [Bacteroidota bacterium]